MTNQRTNIKRTDRPARPTRGRLGRRADAGFSLGELLVVSVIGGLIVVVVMQLLITNQRAYTAQAAQVSGQGSLRAGLDVLFSELREVSLNGGDILSANSSSITVRTLRSFGMVCSINTYASQDVTVYRLGQAFARDDSVYVMADNDEDLTTDDVWVSGTVTSVDTTVACPAGQRGQRLTFGGMSSAWTNDSVRVGAPVRSFELYRYGLGTYNGEPFLMRVAPGGSSVPLAGPLRADDGVEFTYYDINGNVTTTLGSINEIEVTLRTLSEARGPNGNPVADSVSIRVQARN